MTSNSWESDLEDLEADTIAATKQLDHQDNLPDQRQAGASSGEQIGRKLWQYHMPQRPPARHVKTSRAISARAGSTEGAFTW